MTSNGCCGSAVDTPGWLHYADIMTRHHHEAGHDHPARAVSPSLLCMSAVEGFFAALGIAGVLWLVVWWVMV